MRGRDIVFFTVNGTRVLLAAPAQATLLCAAAVNVGVTANWILAQYPSASLPLMISDPDTPEDHACAEHLAALLAGTRADPARTRDAVLPGHAHHRLWGHRMSDAYWRSFLTDLSICALVNSVPTVLLGERESPGRVLLGAAQHKSRS